MNLWVRHKRTKIEGRIIGFCPDHKGRPYAMVQVRDKIFDFKLGEFRIIDSPGLRLAMREFEFMSKAES
jgi:ribosomal protein S19